MHSLFAATSSALRLPLICALALLPVMSPAPPVFANTVDPQWQQFLSWWPGEYHNSRQVMDQRTATKDASNINVHQRLIITQVEAPAFGDAVYYAEWQAYANPANVMRQRFYVMEQDGDTLRLNLHIFPTDTAFVTRTAGAYADPAKLDGLTPADMVPLTGCDVFFTPEGTTAFSGAMIKQDCAFPAPGTDAPIYSWSQMRLEPTSFQYLDGWFNPDGSTYMRLAPAWFVFNKQDSREE